MARTWFIATTSSGSGQLLTEQRLAVEAPAQSDEAKTVCACCLVRRRCLAFALGTRQAHGTWGSLTPEERKRLRPARTATAPAANG
jgi:hypothetical protein